MDLLDILAAMHIDVGDKVRDIMSEKTRKEYDAEFCSRCGGKGYIDTGNNDIPCSCAPAGMVVFSVAGVQRPVSGAELDNALTARSTVIVYSNPPAWDACKSSRMMPVRCSMVDAGNYYDFDDDW